jgi:nucleotide-binding universal stress UspA family protein
MKNLLVHVDTDPRAALRVEIALRLAREFGGHLAGLHVIAPPFVPMMTHAPVPPEIIEEQIRVGREEAAKAAATFKGLADASGLSTEWRAVEGFAAEVIARHARYADLTVLGQTDLDQPQYRSAPDLPDRVSLAAGSPALVIPRVGSFPAIGQRIVVAWNASREARRAVSDAMPFLKQARTVTVMAVRPERDRAAHGEVPGADIALFLARHGVKAEAMEVHGEDVAVADLLLSRVADLAADLVVMGSFGYPRLMELALGGVTRAMLAHMTVPVLLSH